MFRVQRLKRRTKKRKRKNLPNFAQRKNIQKKKIDVGDNYFSAKNATVKPGTIVIWTNVGQAIHEVMADKPSSTFDFTSDVMRRDDIHVALFTKPGKYYYHCHFHGGPQRGQWGVITVKAA